MFFLSTRMKDAKLELELVESELADAKEQLAKLKAANSELEAKLKAQETISKEAESKRQAAYVAEKRAEDIASQLTDRLTAKDGELYNLRKEMEDKVAKVENLKTPVIRPST